MPESSASRVRIDRLNHWSVLPESSWVPMCPSTYWTLVGPRGRKEGAAVGPVTGAPALTSLSAAAVSRSSRMPASPVQGPTRTRHPRSPSLWTCLGVGPPWPRAPVIRQTLWFGIRVTTPPPMLSLRQSLAVSAMFPKNTQRSVFLMPEIYGF